MLLGASRAVIGGRLDPCPARVNATWMWDSVLKQARFTVEPYRNQAAAPEKKAADDLLNELAKLAAG